MKQTGFLDPKAYETQLKEFEAAGKKGAHVVFGPDNNIIKCCDEALALFEFHTVAEFTADFFQMHPEYQPSGEQTVRLLRRDVQAAFDGEIVSRKVALASKDGKLLQIRLEMLKMTDEAVICFFNEMFAPAQTPASAADLQDLQTNHMLEFLEHAPSTIFIIDMMGNIIYSNQHAMTSFGIKSKEAFASQFFSRFSKRFQSNLLAKDFMTIHIGKAMLQGVVRFAWDVKRDYHESSGSIRLVRVQYKGTLACIAYLTEFGLDKDSYFDEPLENTLLDDKMWSVLDPMPFVWYFMDLEGNLLDCNMAAVHLFSAQSKRDLVEKWGEVDPEIQSCGTLSEEIVAQNIEAVMNENKIVFEWDHLDLEGQLIPTEITLVRVGIKNRFILSAFVRDLRDQRALEFQRSLDEARLQAVLENVPSAIHLWGMGGALLYCNDKMVDDFGPGSSKEYRQKFLKTQVLNILTDVVKKGAPKSIEAEVKNNQGENVPVERSFFRINYGGNFAVLEFCTDLRLQRAKEVQMEKEKERFKLFFNTVPAVCSLWNENREITMCNYATARLFGLNDPQEFIDYPTRFSPKYQPCGTSSKQKIMAYIEAAFAAGYAEFDWMHLIPKTGELIHCVVSLTRSELGGKPTLIGLTLDQRVHFAKESLLKTEGKRFKQFFDAVPAACEFWDENGELMMCNLAAARLVGLSTPQEFIDKYREITPETQPCGTNSAEKGKAYIDAAFEHGHAEFPWTHLMPETGEQIPTRVTLTRTEFEGRPGLIALTLDLREDVAKEEMLKKDNQRFRRFFDAAPAVCTFWNENRELHMCNEYTANLFGLSSPQEYLERFAELSTEYQPCGTLSRLKAMKLVEEAFSTGFVEFDWMHYRPDTDEEIPTFVTLTLTELEGRPGLMGFAIDQRENQKIEKLLRHERKRFEMLFNIMPAVCTFWSDERKLTMANDNAAKLFGLSDKQEYLDRFAELSPPMQPCGTPSFEKAMSYVEEAFSSGHSTFDWMHQKPSGEQIPAVVSLTLIEIDSKPALIGFTQDMRERVEIGTELERIDVILKNLPMAAHVWDKEHNLLYVNDFMMKLYGYTDEKEYKWDLFKVYPDAQPDGMNSIESSNYHIDIAFEKGYHKIEWVAAAEDGSPLPLECTLIRINYGGVDAVLEFCRDLRKEHEARTLGKEATEKLRLLLDFLPVPMVILDLKLNIIDCNQASVRLYEFYNKEEYIENFINTWPVYQPDGTPTDILFGSILEKSVSFGDQSFECVLNTKYGVGIPMKVSVIPTELGRQKVLLIAGEDLRPRDAVVREQELLKERLQAMIDASPNCCLIIERSGFVTDCNSVAFDFFGVANLKELNRHLKDLHGGASADSNENIKSLVRTKLESIFDGKDLEFNWDFKNTSGEVIPSQITTHSLDFGGTEAVIIYIRDMREQRRYEEEIKQAQDMVYAMVNLSPVACIVTDEHHYIIECNLMAVKFFGVAHQIEIEFSYDDFCPPGYCENTSCAGMSSLAVDKMLAEGNEFKSVCRLRVRGEVVPVEISGKRVAVGNKYCLVMFIKDLRETMKLDEERAQNRQRIAAMLDSSPLASFVIDESYNVLVCNDSVRTLFSLENSLLFMERMDRFCPEHQPDGRSSSEKILSIFMGVFETRTGLDFEWMWQNLEGEAIPCQITLKLMELEGSTAIIAHMQDLRQIKKLSTAAESLEKMAYTDALTGAYNRRFMEEVSAKAFVRSIETGEPFAFAMIDVDNFKPINDTYGHGFGDEVLKILVSRISRMLRKGSAVYRYGGEEFLVLMLNTTLEDAKIAASRIKSAIIKSNFTADGIELPVTASIGVAAIDETIPRDVDEGVKAIMYNADMALYYAKQNGKNMVAYFEDGKEIPFDPPATNTGMQ